MDYNTMINDVAVYRSEKEEPLTIEEFESFTGIHFTVKHNGKMSGMASISTACIVNTHCLKHRNVEGSICQGCFAERNFRMYGNSFEECFVRNYRILTSVDIPQTLMPILNYSIFRIESFGDIENETQAKNYVNLINANPNTQFGWWTKNYNIVKSVFDKYGKPKNLSLVISSLMMNKPLSLANIGKYADKIFTVYTKDFIKENGIEINCGGKHCLTCQLCYRNNGTLYIREKKK